MLIPCPGCGARFPVFEGPTHRYLGASAACWALFNWCVATGAPDDAGRVQPSWIPENAAYVPERDATPLESLLGDAYGVQHHGGESPQAVQSVAVHLLNMHGIISGKTTLPGWPIDRALRKRGVFHKLDPPRTRECALHPAPFSRWRRCPSGHARPIRHLGIRSLDVSSSIHRRRMV